MSTGSSSTARIRLADAIARDIFTSIIVTIISDDRICVTYVVNAVRSPVVIVFAISIRPPNHSTASVETFMKTVHRRLT